MKLYLVYPSNKHKMALLENFETDYKLLNGVGWHSLKQTWRVLNFTFYATKKEQIKKPVIKQTACVSNTSNVIFRADLINEIFPDKKNEIELLPVLIDGKDWVLVNCLKTTSFYNPDKSKFLRSSENHSQIYMIQHVVVNDDSIKDFGLFTLEDSGRVPLIATDLFVEKIKKIGVVGLDFAEIGFLECN
jgi:hypothetical protein